MVMIRAPMRTVVPAGFGVVTVNEMSRPTAGDVAPASASSAPSAGTPAAPAAPTRSQSNSSSREAVKYSGPSVQCTRQCRSGPRRLASGGPAWVQWRYIPASSEIFATGYARLVPLSVMVRPVRGKGAT